MKSPISLAVLALVIFVVFMVEFPVNTEKGSVICLYHRNEVCTVFDRCDCFASE